MGGVDLVLELPTVWAVSSAESFAQGAVDLLEATGVVDVLSFGSECGDVDRLQRVAVCLNSPVYETGVRRFVDEGMPFASSRQETVRSTLGPIVQSFCLLPTTIWVWSISGSWTG